jgi:hypothetical protein
MEAPPGFDFSGTAGRTEPGASAMGWALGTAVVADPLAQVVELPLSNPRNASSTEVRFPPFLSKLLGRSIIERDPQAPSSRFSLIPRRHPR